MAGITARIIDYPSAIDSAQHLPGGFTVIFVGELPMTRISSSELTTDQCQKGLRAAINILHKWRTSDEQACRILHVSRHTYISAQQCDPAWSIALDTDQMQRISLVLNIHAALRLTFENPKNTYGFVSMPNDNDFFNGRSPLEVMSQGDLNLLEETYRRIDALLLGPHGQL